MINKKTFKPFRIEELNWGINTRDYASEIEDKQAQDILNWNFKWNRLVAWRGIDRIRGSVTWNIRGFTTDSDDIYEVRNKNIYKNWIELFTSTNVYNLSVPNPSWEIFSISLQGQDKTFYVPELEEASAYTNLEWQLNSFFWGDYTITYSSGTYSIQKVGLWDFSIWFPSLVREIVINGQNEHTKIGVVIDGVEYIIEWDINPYEYLDNNVPTANYFLSRRWWKFVIARKDSTEINISFNQYDRKTYTLAYQDRDTPDEYFLEYNDTTVDWNNYRYFPDSRSRNFPWDKIIKNLSGVRLTWPNYSFSSNSDYNGWAWVRFLNKTDWAVVSSFTYDDIDVTDIRLTDVNGTVLEQRSISIGQPTGFDYIMSANTEYRIEVRSTVDTLRMRACYFQDDNWDNDIFQLRWYSLDWAGGSSIWNRNSVGIYDIEIDWNLFDSSTYTSSFVYDTSASGFNQSHYMYIRRNDYSDMVISTNNRYDNPTRAPDDTAFTTIDEINHLAVWTWNSYSQINIGLTNSWTQLGDDDLYQVTVAEQGLLLVSVRWLKPIFIDNDGNATEIWVSSVGTPTVWTIYNWKIILGWYKDSDNIIYSKTSSPTEPNNILDFSWFDSGWQSISWGNKWNIKWFMVWENWLYVFKENEIWYTNSEQSDSNSNSFNFIFRKITSNWASSQFWICEVEQEIFYFDYKNRAIRRLGYEQNLTTLRDTAVSGEIENILERIPEDDEWNDERYSKLTQLSYKYPYLELSYADEDSEYLYVSWVDENWRYRIPGKTLVYNTESKSWTRRDDKDSKKPLFSHKWKFCNFEWEIFDSLFWFTENYGIYESKDYVFWDDIMMKKFWRFELIWSISSIDSRSKELILKIYIDWEELDSRVFTANWDKRIQIREKVDLYDIGQVFKFTLEHSGVWEVEVHDVQIYYKGTSIQAQDYN